MPKGISKNPEITKQKRRQKMLGNKINIGRTLSEETKKKLSEIKKGKLPKNFYEMQKRGHELNRGKPAWNRGKKLGSNPKHSLRMTGRKQTEEEIQKRIKTLRPMWESAEWRKKMSEARKGEKSHLWRGGITPINLKIRGSLEMKQWIQDIFQRDNYTCKFCEKIGGKLNADHIKPFAWFPKLRFELSNGQTLCKDCHNWKTKWDMKIYTGKIPELNFIN